MTVHKNHYITRLCALDEIKKINGQLAFRIFPKRATVTKV